MADISKTVQIIFNAEDKTSATLNTLEKEGQETFSKIEGSAKTSADGMKAAWDSLKEHWVGITLAITAAMATVYKAWDLASQAAQYEEQKAALDNLASHYGTTADDIIASLKQVSDGLISNKDAVSVAAKGLMVGLNPDQLVKFMEVVVATTNVTGKSVGDSFEALINAASTGRERALKEMGILTDLGDAYKEYAASIGKNADELTESEKQVAGINAILKDSGKILNALGDQGTSTADKMEQFTSMMSDLKLELGGALITAGQTVVGVLNGLASGALGAVEGFAKLMETVNTVQASWGLTESIRKSGKEAAEYWKGVAEAAGGAAEEVAGKASKMFEAAFNSSEKASSGVKKVIEVTNDGKISIEEMAEAIKKYGDGFQVVNGQIVPLVASTKEAATALKKLDDEIFGAKKEQTDAWTALAMEYNKKEVELRKEGVTDLSKLDEWYAAKSNELKQKDIEAAKKVGEEKRKDTEKSIDQMVKFKLGLEEIQSKERVSVFEIQTKVDLAKIDASSKAFDTMFKSIDSGMVNTGDQIGKLFDKLTSAPSMPVFWMIEDAIKSETALRKQQFDLQKKLIEEQIKYMALKSQKLSKGEALINISADGMEPELEAFMWQILKRIQIRANAEGAEYLLGLGV